MSVHAGDILTVGGANVIDRIQSAGLGDVRLPIETIREVGNRLVVDKVPGEPDFTFTMEALDTSTDLMAFLTGRPGGGSASGAVPGSADASGTEYKWEDCQFVNITSPWKDPTTGSAGHIVAGHLIPGYYPTRLRYRFGVTDNATQEVELGGGAFYYAGDAPVEDVRTGNGASAAFVSSDTTIGHRLGGAEGSTFRNVFGVLVNGVLQVDGVDFNVTVAGGGANGVATVTFATAPASGAIVKFSYFTSASKSYPQTVHAATIVKPGAVRGRNIKVYLGSGSASARVAGVQSMELEATVEGEVEREMGNEEITGRVINGLDTNGSLTVRSKDSTAFLNLLSKVTGVDTDEVYGWFNDQTIRLEIRIENPKDPGTILKTLVVDDAKFQPPGTPARVNTPTDFVIRWESLNGTFSEFKGTPA